MIHLSSRRCRGEDGAFLVLWALLLVAILTMVAIVIDLGALRADRRQQRAAADAAATAGANDLIRGAGEACLSAWNYAMLNLGLSPTSPSPCGPYLGSPPPACSPSIPKSVTGTAGGYTVTISHPVLDTDPIVVGADAVGGDIAQPVDTAPGSIDGKPCERVGVQVRYTRRSLFAKVVGNNQNTTTVHSVARFGPGGPQDEPASLVLLERHDCRAARVQGTNSRIVVASVPGVTPGNIQADSAGDGACSGNTKILEGGSGNLGPSIFAEHARNGAGVIVKEARIGIYGKLLGATNAHTPWPAEIGEPDPVGFRQIGRTPVDERFLENVRQLENTATPVVDMTTRPVGFVDATGPAPGLNLGCTIDTPTPITTAMGTRLWFNCPSGLTVKNLTIDSAAAEVVIAGPLTVNGTGFTIRDARKVWIRGRSDGNKKGVDLSAPFIVNNGGFSTCAARFSAARGDIGTLFVKEGSFVSSGTRMQLCQTHVYLRGAANPTAASTLPAGVTLPPALPPEPGPNASIGQLDVGAGSVVDWTAPNELDVLPTLADLAIHKFEDLALWTESSDENPLNGGGGMKLGGIFFLPNANAFKMSGNAGQLIDVDAQFLVRKLEVTGGATLRMVPNPADQVPIPTARVSLIR